MRIVRPACLTVFLSLTSVSIPLCIAQEGTSLGDVARKLRANRNGVAATAPASQSAIQPHAKQIPATIQIVAGPVIEKSEDTYRETIRSLFTSGKYEEIDRIAAAARASKARLRGGYWELHILYAALEFPAEPDRGDSDFESQIGRLKQWMAQRPESITPRVVLADVYRKYAWRARGDRYAADVSEEQWRVFNERVHLATEVLHNSMKLDKDAEWYLTLQLVSRDEGVELEGQKAIFDQAVAFEPGYQYFYRALGEMLMLRWLGEEGDLARFAERASDKIGGKQGDLIYYHIGSYIWCHCDSNPEFESLDWPRIKRGYLVQRELYGDAGYAVSQMARIAVGRDWELSDELFTKLNGERDAQVWPSQEEYEQAKIRASYFANAARADNALKLADHNLTTLEGRTYSDQLATTFSHDYSTIVQQCAFTTGSTTYAPFRVAIQIGKTGVVEKPIQVSRQT